MLGSGEEVKRSLLRGISQVSEKLEEIEGKADGSYGYPNNRNTIIDSSRITV